ILLAYFKVLRL
ncbi:hypothetical protein FOXB_03411, partial [Fusarium oxysporum f. sp. conglutinans Fo5176]